MWQESRTRKAVPPPMCLFLEQGETVRGKLGREKPAGLDSKSSAEVVEGVIQVSVKRKIIGRCDELQKYMKGQHGE